MEKYESMKNDANVSNIELETLRSEIETLESLYDNYNLGMNYFRRAKGGRSGLRE
jgi:colicin import membrane protein